MSDPILVPIRELTAPEVEARLGQLSDILVDAVAGGASVNFMAGFSPEAGRAFWRDQLGGLMAGEKRLFVGEVGQRIVGTTMLMFAPQPNQPHRADVGKMLVHSSVRRQGVGRKLLMAVEAAACEAGRTLLMLDTESGSAGDHLYRRCGWLEIGRVPGHAFRPDGCLAETTFFYKRLM